jgi:hypothetical protein
MTTTADFDSLRGRWTDGQGRITIKRDTGDTLRNRFVMRDGQPIGVCRAPGWLQIYGAIRVHADLPPGVSYDVMVQENREQMAARARYHWKQRHGPRAERSRGYGPNYDADVVDYDPDDTVN